MMKTAIITKMFFIFLLVTNWACQLKTKTAKTTDTTGHGQKHKAYVLQKNEGEILPDRRGGTMIIKVSPETGAAHLSMGAREMPMGTNIAVHRHDHAEEILFVHRGNGMVIVDDDTINVSEGATLFIPPGIWHGVRNPNDSMNILFIVTPPGQEKVFRALASTPGTWTPAQIDSIRNSIGTFLKKE
ncbi:MAG TPA: cupin domain-containing protein [Chitinophagaceae bacterium]|nr:cupin domain-containing protein [Chitinophagaceae bacterium]